MRLLAPISANLLVFLSVLSLGSLLRPLLSARRRIDRAAVIVVGGIGLLGVALFCVGLIRFSHSWIAAVLFGSIAIGLPSLLAEFREWKRQSAAPVFIPWLAAAIVFVILIITAVGAFAEPAGDMNNDAFAYHYLGPTVWLRHGVIRPVPDEVLTFFPVVAETTFAALMAIGGNLAPGLFALLHLVALFLAAASVALRDVPQSKRRGSTASISSITIHR